MADKWVLIFSDGTGQRGVRDDMTGRNTNVFRMFEIAEAAPAGHATFYDAGLGAPRGATEDWTGWGHRLLSKATGLGISRNIAECYAGVMQKWQEGMPIGVFGFSRGAYTVRSLGGVLSACGVATAGFSRDDTDAALRQRHDIAREAVKIYQMDPADRQEAADAYRAQYECADVVPRAIGVFDTVRALGLPGVMDAFNPLKHVFHDEYLSSRVEVGLQAYAIDENRKVFKPVAWQEDEDAGSQTLEQVWFPGVHSDIGGGYADDDRLAGYAFDWMTRRLSETCGLDLANEARSGSDLSVGQLHNEREGFGVFWIKGTREAFLEKNAEDDDRLCDDIEHRLTEMSGYRPVALDGHPRVVGFFRS